MPVKPDPSRSTKPDALSARRAALALLRAVVRDRMALSDLQGAAGPLAQLQPAERARAQRLASAVLRHLDQIDALLSAHIERLPPIAALSILRLAAAEITVFKDAPHGVVHSAVTLMKATGQGKFAGLANAVLRKLADRPDALEDMPPPQLPQWLRRRVVHIYDEDSARAMERAYLAGAPLDLTLRDPDQAAAFATALEGEVLPTGGVRLSGKGQVSRLHGYAEGEWWVQDAAASVAARLLRPQQGERVLDLCAAPGGKTMQLAAMGADVTALDLSRSRLSRVEENLTRTKLSAKTVAADALTWDPETPFQAILLDAPCSATGTIRRHPDLPFVRNGKDLDRLFELQKALLDRAALMLGPGGRLVFCTCSLLTEEGEAQAKRAIAEHGLVELEPDMEALGLDPAWRGRDGLGIRLRPDFWAERGGMDGFFMISLRKPQ